MESITQCLQTHLDIVFFIYGMAFLVMGISIIFQPKDQSELSIARDLWLLAMFGLTHGANELFDMWALIRGRSAIFDVIRLVMLVSSYGFLFEFGRKFFKADIRSRLLGRLFPYAIAVLGAAVLIAAVLSADSWNRGGNLSRYFMGFPGSLLTGLGLLRYKAREEQPHAKHISAAYSYMAGGSFLCYAFFAGIVVNPDNIFPADIINTQVFLALTGFPVQVFRASCAMVAVYGMVSMLSVLDWEAREKIREALAIASAAKRDFHSIVSRNADGIVVTDTRGIVRFVNPMAVMFTGRSKEDLLGKPLGWELRKGLSFNIPLADFNGRAGCGEVFVSETQWDGKPAYLVAMRDTTERLRSEDELKLLKMAIEQAAESVFITDAEGFLNYVNPAFEASTGYSRQEVVGKKPRILKSGAHDAAFYRELWETISSGRNWKGRLVNKRKNGSLLTEETTISPVLGAGGRIVNYVAVKRDVTEQVRLESELRQSQKMESVGRLAGGVAHDFNNILTAISGYAGLALAGLPEGDLRRDDLKEVLAASERAARLTKQLLAFSRKQMLKPEVVDMNDAVAGIAAMLKRLIGEDVKLETRFATLPCLVKVDVGQMEQVFLNLAVNARDAMPKGGILTFKTEIQAADETFLSRYPNMFPGPVVCLSASDTGCGMTDEVKAHLFEPFFTTKEKGRGTGLGLSTVYGIIKQSGGDIEVESAPGHGTTFRIYLPQVDARMRDKNKDKKKDVMPRGSETVLLVDDDDAVRRLGERVIENHGYTVLTASNAQEALRVVERHGRPVDLLVTDVVMPGMSGPELAKDLIAKGVVCRTIFMSGYTADAIDRHGMLDSGVVFIYKPFAPVELVIKMREVLDCPTDQAGA